MLPDAASSAFTSSSSSASGGRVTSLALITLAVTIRSVPLSRRGISSGKNRRCFTSTNLSTTSESTKPARAQKRRNSMMAVMCAFTVLPVRGRPVGVDD